MESSGFACRESRRSTAWRSSTASPASTATAVRRASHVSLPSGWGSRAEPRFAEDDTRARAAPGAVVRLRSRRAANGLRLRRGGRSGRGGGAHSLQQDDAHARATGGASLRISHLRCRLDRRSGHQRGARHAEGAVYPSTRHEQQPVDGSLRWESHGAVGLAGVAYVTEFSGAEVERCVDENELAHSSLVTRSGALGEAVPATQDRGRRLGRHAP